MNDSSCTCGKCNPCKFGRLMSGVMTSNVKNESNGCYGIKFHGNIYVKDAAARDQIFRDIESMLMKHQNLEGYECSVVTEFYEG